MIFSIHQKTKTKTAFYTIDREMSYGELAEAIRQMEAQLAGKKLVFCFGRNSIASAVGYLGILDQGSVPLLLDPKMNRKQLETLYESYRPQLFWIPKELWEEWREEWEGAERFQYEDYLLVAPGGPFREASVQDTKGAAALTHEGIHEQLALLLTTSGSTGSPKLVRLSRENLISNAASICQYLEIGEEERAITSLPMYYTYGLSIIHSHLLAGASVILTEDSVLQDSFWQLAGRREATSLSGVPYTYQLLDRLHFFAHPSKTVRVMTQAGGKLSEGLQRKAAAWAREQGVRFYIMYGQTEATARMAYLPPDRSLEKPGSLGIAIPGGRLWLEDEGGRLVSEPGRTGELYYQGPNVSLGYAGSREDLARGDERGGILATGDLAQFDEEGYFYIVGRKSRFLKLYGRRISLDSCEKMLEDAWRQGTILPESEGGTGGLQEAEFACVGDDTGILVACTGRELAEPAGRWLCQQLDLSRRAVRSLWMPRLPRTSQGKKNYKAIQEQQEEGDEDGAFGA